MLRARSCERAIRVKGWLFAERMCAYQSKPNASRSTVGPLTVG